jgi:hypothetical protein
MVSDLTYILKLPIPPKTMINIGNIKCQAVSMIFDIPLKFAELLMPESGTSSKFRANTMISISAR